MAGKAKAGSKMERYDTVRTPKGIAGFSFLREPDEKFGAKHRIQLFIDANDPEAKVFVKKLMDTKQKYLALINKKDDGKVPGLKKADKYLADRFGSHGVKEGSLYFEFTSNARKVDGTDDWQFVEMFNVKNEVSPDLRVFGGDVVRVAVTLMGYNTGKEYGVKAYLNAVQVLVKKGGGRVNPFADESTPETDSPESIAAMFGDETTDPAPKADEKVDAKEEKSKAGKSATAAKSSAVETTVPSATESPSEDGEINLSDLV